MDKKDLLSVPAFFIAWSQKTEKFIKYKFVFYTLRVQFLFALIVE